MIAPLTSYTFDYQNEEEIKLSLLHTESFVTNPEALLFLPAYPALIISCRNTNYLTSILLPLAKADAKSEGALPVDKEFFNLNENGDNHISYSVYAFICFSGRVPKLNTILECRCNFTHPVTTYLYKLTPL